MTESDQILLPSKWKKDMVGAWRMDVNIEVGDEIDDTDDSDDIEDSDDESSIESVSDSSDSE